MNGPIVKWDCPNQEGIGVVSDAGVVVTVTIVRRPGEPNVTALNGVPPHVIYVPDVAPLGTGAFQQWDPRTGAVGAIVGATPRANRIISGAQNQQPFYRISLGCPFVAPFAGRILLDGGTVPAGGTSAHDVIFQRSRPELRGEMEHAIDLNHTIIAHRLSLLGVRPEDPTMTYVNVGSTPIDIPRGAQSIHVPESASVDLAASGISLTLNLEPGAGEGSNDVGFFAGASGTFAANGGGTIKLVTFKLKIA